MKNIIQFTFTHDNSTSARLGVLVPFVGHTLTVDIGQRNPFTTGVLEAFTSNSRNGGYGYSAVIRETNGRRTAIPVDKICMARVEG